MKKVTKKELRKTALKLLPAIYDSAMRTGAEDGLFQHEDWRTGLCLDAFLLAEAFEDAAAYRDAESEPKLKQLKRDKVELTGSDLARAMLERGDKFVMCKVWNKNYGDINQFVDVVLGYRTDLEKFTSVEGNRTDFANPINPRTGEPLTQSEAGL